MMTRIRRVIVASLAMLAVASTCFSQVAVPPAGADAAPGAPAAADSAAKAAAPAKGTHRVGMDAAGRAGIGGMMGGSYFYAADDFSKGALPRFDFSGHWRYSFSDQWRGQLSIGFTWTAYDKSQAPPFQSIDFPEQTSKEGYITQLVPISVEIQRRFGGPKWQQHVGVGPGLYRVMVQDERKVQKDPVTYETHRGMFPGFTVEWGMEHFLRNMSSTSFEINAATHYVFAKDDEKFPSGFSSALGALCVRAGMNYYFDTGILKPKTKEPLPGSGGGKKK